MPLQTTTEIERKYDVDADLEVPDLGTVARVRDEPPVVLRAVYFDTPDNALADNAIVLRRRSGGTDEGWHVKYPAEVGRTEIRAPLGDATTAQSPPGAILDAVRSLFDGAGRRGAVLDTNVVQETARLTTQRSTLTLLDPDGAALAAVTDDLVSATDVRTGILRVWREWEVELAESLAARPKDGLSLLDRIEKLLLAAGAEPSRSLSKFDRATGRGSDGKTVLPAPPGRATAAEVPTALAVANTIVASLTVQLLAAEPLVRADAPDAVHLMRVTVRRLRGVLAAFHGLWEAADVTALREHLRQLGDVLGAARDAEVRRLRAETLLEQDAPAVRDMGGSDADGNDAGGNDAGASNPDARRRLVDDAHGEYEAQLTELQQYLDSSDYAHVLSALRRLVNSAAVTESAGQPARSTLRKALRRQQRRSRRRLARADRTDLDSLHTARKAARRLRYVAEALSSGDSPLLGEHVRSLAAAAEQVQDVLGSHRDAVLFVERLSVASTEALEAGESTAVYAALETAERRHSKEALDRVDAAEQELSRAAKL